MLALISSIVRDLSNVKFGPELYCVSAQVKPPDVVTCIANRLNAMVEDLDMQDVHCVPSKSAHVRLGRFKRRANHANSCQLEQSAGIRRDFTSISNRA